MKEFGRSNMNRRLKPIVVSTALCAAASLGTPKVLAATTCEGLLNLSLPHGQVTTAQTISGGTFNTPPGCATGSTGCTTNTGLPQFCRVAGTATPTNDSIINFEVWIPTDDSFNGEAVDRHEAAAALIRLPEGWPGLDPLRLRVDVGKADFYVLGPIWHEAPAQHVEAALSGL